jgi:hypothetical protein
MKNKSKFVATLNKGFQMTFENGFTISVQFGLGNYCQHKNNPVADAIHESKDAEVMVWNSEGETIKINGTDVNGWCNTNQVAEIMQYVKNR